MTSKHAKFTSRMKEIKRRKKEEEMERAKEQDEKVEKRRQGKEGKGWKEDVVEMRDSSKDGRKHSGNPRI